MDGQTSSATRAVASNAVFSHKIQMHDAKIIELLTVQMTVTMCKSTLVFSNVHELYTLLNCTLSFVVLVFGTRTRSVPAECTCVRQ